MRLATSGDELRALSLDPTQAAREKVRRRVRLHTIEIPRLRALGCALLAVVALAHNQFILGEFSWLPWSRLLAFLGLYGGLSWGALHLFYEDVRWPDLGLAFLIADMAVLAVVVHATGAEQSWLFVLMLVRVADQMPAGSLRTLGFAHLAPVAFVAVIAYAAVAEGRPISWTAEMAKALLLYAGGLYLSLVARPAEQRSRRTGNLLRVAKDLIRDLEEASEQLNASKADAEHALAEQARLANDNARLYETSQRQQVRLQQIFDSTSDGIIFVGFDGRIESANVRAGELLGFDPSVAVGRDVTTLLSRLYTTGGGDSFVSTVRRLLAEPGPGGQGYLQQPASGRVFQWEAQPTRDGAGGTVGLTFTFQDVTKTRDLIRQLQDKSTLLEDARRKAEDANRAKDEFLANVSHEIRTPLSAILGMTQLVLETGLPPEPHANLLRVQSSAEALMVVINDILDLSKIEARKLTLERVPFTIARELDSVIETVRLRADQKGIRLGVTVLPEVPEMLVGDPNRLRQVLLNLVGNAVKFTSEGEVGIRVGLASQTSEEICLHFAVRDTGIGIPREKQQSVFDAFAQADGSTTRRFGGTGLGLSISARLVELMGGDIWVESDVGQGSTFRFTALFQFQRKEPQEAAPVRAPAAEAGRQKTRSPRRVLVAEDEEVHRELVAQLLGRRGHLVTTVTNGREALRRLELETFDILLLDLQMPELDGFQATARIRERERVMGGHLPIVAMTASVSAGDRARCLRAGMDRYVTKPLMKEALFAAVEGAAPPPIDLATTRARFLEGLGDDVTLARRLIDLFLSNSRGLLASVQDAIEREDRLALRQAAHALRGAVANFPADTANEAAGRMEAFGLSGDFAGARAAYPALEDEITTLREVLPDLIAGT
jgi:PAS domain S-box-containing protein